MLIKFELWRIYLQTLFVSMMMSIAGAASAIDYCAADVTPQPIDFGTVVVPYDAVPGQTIGRAQPLHVAKSSCPSALARDGQILRYKSIFPLGGTSVWKTSVPGIGIRITETSPAERFISAISPGDGYKNLQTVDDDFKQQYSNYSVVLVRLEGSFPQGAQSINVMDVATYDVSSNTYGNNEDVTARFTLEGQTCREADNSDTQNPIVLPSVSRQEINSQTMSGVKSFTLRIKCDVPDDTGIHIYLTDVITPGNVTGELTTKGVKNVALRITRDREQIVGFGETNWWPLYGMKNNGFEIPMKVGYIATGSVDSGGAISAQAVINFEFN